MKFSYAYASMKGGMITNIKKGDYATLLSEIDWSSDLQDLNVCQLW